MGLAVTKRSDRQDIEIRVGAVGARIRYSVDKGPGVLLQGLLFFVSHDVQNEMLVVVAVIVGEWVVSALIADNEALTFVAEDRFVSLDDGDRPLYLVRHGVGWGDEGETVPDGARMKGEGGGWDWRGRGSIVWEEPLIWDHPPFDQDTKTRIILSRRVRAVENRGPDPSS